MSLVNVCSCIHLQCPQTILNIAGKLGIAGTGTLALIVMFYQIER